jgi:ribosome-associated protein
MTPGPGEEGRPGDEATPVAVSVPIALGRFLKAAVLVGTGGEAKQMVGMGLVRVNGEVETRRGRKLEPGDTVEYDGAVVVVAAEAAPQAED